MSDRAVDSARRKTASGWQEELGAPTPPETTKPDGSWQRHIHWTNSPERWCQLCPWNCCPRAAAAAGVALRFEWRPFWTEAMVSELEATAVSCERGHRDCPDLVLVNGALWYQLLSPRLEMAELMRQQVSRAAPALARLASLTRLVWKLDEETINDIVTDVHRSGPAEVPTLHAVVYDAARKIPGLVIWSSALPESTGFTRIKCQPLKKFVRSGVLNEATFHHECGQDVVHGSVAVMTKAVQMMFTDLCARDLDFTTLEEETQNMSVMPPFCCSTQMDT
ncbi:hypothetical protein FJT64_017331 [Amphibalanus amphitrite]|uniref:Uncharacterized protein n=1 Tax=Amphibalanus amphitrite TaxID=1232801 RepID=A0A6A4X6Z1_AMPAM|nr:hypothetical protein FJT64_017331 [Amphibalanus amphitrite]